MAQQTGKRRDAFPAYYFTVEIKNAGFSGTAYFRSVSGLKSEAEVVSLPEGGLNWTEHKLVGRTKYPNLVLKQGFADGSLVQLREQFSIQEKIKRFNGTIVQLGPEGKKHKWLFEKGWICKWEGPELDASKNEISIETIEIAHEGLFYQGG